MTAKMSKPLLFLSLIGLAVGTYGIVEALVQRTEATNLTSYMPWGLGVALYLLFLGLSAGGLLASCLIYILKIEMGSIDRNRIDSSKFTCHFPCFYIAIIRWYILRPGRNGQK